MADQYINSLPELMPHECPDLAQVELRLKVFIRHTEENPLKVLAGIQVYLETRRAKVGWLALEAEDDSKIAGTGKAVKELRQAINFIQSLVPEERKEDYARTCRDYREHPPARL